jgi:hypothetical protein
MYFAKSNGGDWIFILDCFIVFFTAAKVDFYSGYLKFMLNPQLLQVTRVSLTSGVHKKSLAMVSLTSGV